VKSRLPYPISTAFYINSDFHGYSHYNAANVKFEHRAGDMAVTAVLPGPGAWTNKSAAAGVGRRPDAGFPGIRGQP